MKLSQRNLLLATISYADIFSYARTREEVLRWFVRRKTETIVKPRHVTAVSKSGRVFWFLRGRRGLISLRLKREQRSLHKREVATRIAQKLRIIPTLLLVGLTGGLAVGNAKSEDDIDLFFITRTGTLWVTRFLTVVCTEFLGLRRRPEDTNVRDKVCLNMFMAEDHLRLFLREQDLFSAHEVLQMQPLWEKEGVYKKFLSANRWVEGFLPNAWREKVKSPSDFVQGRRRSKVKRASQSLPFTFFEPLARAAQLWYMQRRRTNEVIADGVLRFHPVDARAWVKDEFALRLRPFNIPLDKIFYGR